MEPFRCVQISSCIRVLLLLILFITFFRGNTIPFFTWTLLYMVWLSIPVLNTDLLSSRILRFYLSCVIHSWLVYGYILLCWYSTSSLDSCDISVHLGQIEVLILSQIDIVLINPEILWQILCWPVETGSTYLSSFWVKLNPFTISTCYGWESYRHIRNW